MEEVGVVSEEELDVDVDEPQQDDVDLFNNNRRLSSRGESVRRASLGLPDNGTGLTKHYYNIERPMSVTSLVELIIKRRTGHHGGSRRRSSQLSPELEERIKKTLAWKEMEDELNKEDIMVSFRKKMREKRKVARQSIPKERKISKKINEERRIQLRTSLLETNTTRRSSTTESIKEAIQEFRMNQPQIVDEPEVLKDYEESQITSDIVVKRTRELLEQLGYLKPRQDKEADKLKDPSKTTVQDFSEYSSTLSRSDTTDDGVKKKRARLMDSSFTSTIDKASRPKTASQHSQNHGRGRQRSASAGRSKTVIKTPPSKKHSRESKSIIDQEHAFIEKTLSFTETMIPLLRKDVEWQFDPNTNQIKFQQDPSIGIVKRLQDTANHGVEFEPSKGQIDLTKENSLKRRGSSKGNIKTPRRSTISSTGRTSAGNRQFTQSGRSSSLNQRGQNRPFKP